MVFSVKCELRVSRNILANLTVGICCVVASVWCEDTLGARVLGDVAGMDSKDTLLRECVEHPFIVLLALGLIVFAATCVKVE